MLTISFQGISGYLEVNSTDNALTASPIISNSLVTAENNMRSESKSARVRFARKTGFYT